jgi:hypothetical protein
VRPSGFRLVSGAPARFQSTARGTRTFCGRCGTQITFQDAGAPDEIDVTICSLDDPERLAPQDHTQTGSRLRWLDLADGLPEYPEGRSDG